MMRCSKDWLRSEGGASAAEFALIVPAFVLLIFGIIHMSLMLYSAQQLNYAAEATARCLVVSTNSGYASASCRDNTSATSYFKTMYHGPTATFTLSTLDETQTCATAGTYQVVATTNYIIRAGFLRKSVPLTAKACFPHA
jgi:Flp pilus assembly protein TadG